MGFVSTHVLALCWELLQTTPAALKNPTHSAFFPTKDALREPFSVVTFAPGVEKLLVAAQPPTINQLKRISVKHRGCWGVYLLVLEKNGQRPKVYVGSGTERRQGLRNRFEQYDNLVFLPHWVKKAVDNGYRITHRGVLCRTLIPDPRARIQLRSLFLILETLFAFTFWTMVSRTKDYGMPHLLPWSIKKLEYDGCCTHPPIYEPICGDNATLTPEEKAEKEVELDKRRRARMHQVYEDRKAKFKAQDAEGYRRQRNEVNNAYRKDVRTSEKFKCELCDKNFSSASHLALHEQSISHIAIAENKSAAEVKASIIASNGFECKSCKKSFATLVSLKHHNASNSHLAKEANVSEADYIALVIASNKYRCLECEKSFATSTQLLHHKRSPAHIAQETGRSEAEVEAEIIASKQFSCGCCNKTYATAKQLHAHNMSPSHKAKAKLKASSASSA